MSEQMHKKSTPKRTSPTAHDVAETPAPVVGDKLMDTTAFADLEYGWILDEAPEPIRAMLEAKRDGTFNRLDGETGKEMIRRITGMPPSTFYEFCGEWVRSVLDGAPDRKLALT